MPQILFALAAMAVFVFTVVEVWELNFLGQVFPLFVAACGLVAVAILLFTLLSHRNGSRANFDLEVVPRDIDLGSSWYFMGWIAGMVVLTALIGFFLAIAVFFVAFLRIVAKLSWFKVVVLTAAA